VVSIKQSGITKSYINELKLNGTKNQIFTLKIRLLTERPKILHNTINLTDAFGSSGILEVGILFLNSL
jgi:predicted enzyme involved in methoxymalonyl-ACP biosynthesis